MTVGSTIALTIGSFVHKVMSLLFSTPSRFVIALLPRSIKLLKSFILLKNHFPILMDCPRSLAAGPKTRRAHPENPGASGRPQPPSSKRAQGPFLMPRGRSFEMIPVPASLFWRRLAAEYVASRSNQSLKQIPTFRAECHRGDVWPGSRKSVLSFPHTLSHPKVWTARVQGPH